MLCSRVHALLSDTLAVLSYDGHRSGRTFHIPVRYAELGDDRLVAIAVRPERKLWWRSFAEPRDATLELRGHRVRVVGRLVEGDVRKQAAAAYASRYPHSAGLASDAALVVFQRAG